MLKIDDATLNTLVKVAVISAKRIRGLELASLSGMDRLLHPELVALGILAPSSNGRVGQILLPDVD